jgi:hypothetical protein
MVSLAADAHPCSLGSFFGLPAQLAVMGVEEQEVKYA